MAIIRGIVCDNCGGMIYWCGNVSKREVAKYAREQGWAIGKRCLCENCKSPRKTRTGGLTDG